MDICVKNGMYGYIVYVTNNSMIKFKTIKWMNFLSTGNDWIEVQLDANPLTLIVGNNGAGKSTLLDALHYVLFGKAYRNINLPQLVNSINQTGMLVEVEFTIGSKQYKIKRGMKPTTFEIYENEQLIEQEAARRDYQKYLERNILNLSSRTFKQIVIVGNDSYIPFMRLDASDRRAVIENLLDIGIFSTMNQILRDQCKISESKLQDVKTKVTQTLEKIELQKKHIRANRKSNGEQIVDLQNELVELQTQSENIRNEIQNIDAQINTLITQTVEHDKIATKASNIERLRIRIDQNRQKVERVLAVFEKNANCPTCNQTLDNKEIVCQMHHSQLDEINKGLAELEGKHNEYAAELLKIRNVMKSVDVARSQRIAYQQQSASLEQQQESISKRIDALKAQPISQETLAISQELINNLSQLNASKANTIQQMQYQDLCSMLLKDSGIKSRIIEQYLPVINTTVNQYLTQLDFFVDFNIDSSFTETIKSRHRDIFSYENFSAGQKRRIDLALLFTWRAVSKLKNSADCNILILDEVLDGSLDADGLEEFVSLLTIFSSSCNSFVISHRGDVLADKFPNVIEFSLAGNFTEITSR